MSFNPGGTDYRGAQSSRDRADEGLTRALDRKGRADKQKRIKSETSDMAGLANILRIGYIQVVPAKQVDLAQWVVKHFKVRGQTDQIMMIKWVT